MAESPTCPMYILPRLMKATLAVVPAVLGKPVTVLGHFSVTRNVFNYVIVTT